MNVPHGALRMIELASVRMFDEVGVLIDDVEHTVTAGNAKDVHQSACALTKRLRLVLSAMTPVPEPIAMARLLQLAEGLPAHTQLDYSTLDPADHFEAPLGRVLLNVLLLASSSLPKGGVIRLAGGSPELFIQIDGPEVAWPAGFAACIADPAEAQQALQAAELSQMAFTAALAHTSGVRLSMVFPPKSGLFPPILRLGGR